MSRTHTAPLAPYLLNARQGPNFPAPNRSTTILNWSQNSNSNSNSTPMLRSDRLNGVILFAGCFNPPHRGHFQALRHAMQQCGPNLNLIAAVVSLKTDQTLAQKLCEGRYAEADGLVFGLEDRKMQWRGNVSTDNANASGGRNSSGSGSGHPRGSGSTMAKILGIAGLRSRRVSTPQFSATGSRSAGSRCTVVITRVSAMRIGFRAGTVTILSCVGRRSGRRMCGRMGARSGLMMLSMRML